MSQDSRPAFQKWLNTWLPRDSAHRSLATSLLVGIGITLVLLVLQQAGVVRGNSKWADTVMPYYAEVVVRKDRAKPFAFIDIDDETHRLWGEPIITPRDKLRELIEFSVKGDAAVVVVDIELSRTVDEIIEPLIEAKQTSAASMQLFARQDHELYAFLSNHARDVHGSRPVPIVLVRDYSLGYKDPDSEEYFRPRPSFLDDVVHNSRFIYWASPLFLQEANLAVQRWRLWEIGCVDGHREVLPSVQLLVSALVLDKPFENATALRRRLEGLAPEDCASATTISEKPAFVELENREIQLTRQDMVQQRIFYTLGWESKAEAVSGGKAKRQAQVLLDNVSVPLLVVLPARHITEKTTEDMRHLEVDSRIVKNRIVVIGASHQDSRDFHNTPLGVMPGAMIIINAINTLLQHSDMRQPKWWQEALLSLSLVLLVAVYFHFLHDTIANYASLFTIFITTLVASIFFMESGVWIDISLPALGLVIYKWFIKLYGIWEKRSLGIKVLLGSRVQPKPAADVSRNTDQNKTS